MATGRVDFAALTVGTSITGFTPEWSGQAYEAVADGATLAGKFIRKAGSNGFDLLAFTALTQGTVTEIVWRVRLRLNAGTLYGVTYSNTVHGFGVDVFYQSIGISKVTNGFYAAIGSTVNYAATAQAPGAFVYVRVRWEPGINASTGILKAKAWLPGDAEPGSWMLTESRSDWPVGGGSLYPGIHSFATNRLEADYLGWATAGGTAPMPALPPDTPTVDVYNIRRTTAYGLGSAYSHPQGDTHTATKVRVSRVSDSTVLYGPVTLGAVEGPSIATGLPDGPEGAGGRPTTDPDYTFEFAYQGANGLWSDWGESDPFQTLNLWESGEFVSWLDVLIERPEGMSTVMQSYADFGGRNWIKSAKVDPAGVDSPIGSFTLSLHRQVGEDSLAPLVTQSPLNLDDAVYKPALDFGREAEFYAAVMARGEEPDMGDWVPLLRGITDDIEWPRKSGDVTVPGRDYSGKLADTLTRVETKYGSDVGVDSVEVMQAVVDDGMGAGQYTITDDTTGARFAVTEYIVRDVFVWDALQALALMWGGKEIRQVEGATEAFLTVIEPNRDNTTPDYSIGPDTYIDCSAISTSGKNVRPIVRGRAVDKVTGEILVSQLPAEEDVGTDPLVLLYGPLMFSFDEDSAKGVDTQDELDAMVAAIYADLSTPPIPLEIETKLAPFARVGDVVEWLPDTVLRDESLIAAVLTLSHSFPSPGVGRTTWRCAGKPKGRYKTWQHLGIEVTGIGKRPSLTLSLEQDFGLVTATITVNDQLQSWAIWSQEGSIPKADGIPIPGASKGSDLKPAQRSVSWSVRDGTHYVLARGYADARWVEVSASIVITGIGGPGTGVDAPTDIPGTPGITLGAVDGTSRAFTLYWVNTNMVDGIEFELFLEGVSQGVDSQTAGSTSYATAGEIGEHWSGRVRYTAGVGLEGAWSPMSREALLTEALP